MLKEVSVIMRPQTLKKDLAVNVEQSILEKRQAVGTVAWIKVTGRGQQSHQHFRDESDKRSVVPPKESQAGEEGVEHLNEG
jgi:nitrogen regulatory protein PII